MESKIKQTAINFVQTEYAPYHKLDLNDKTCFDAEVKHYEEFAKYIFEQGSIQSPDADNTERGERPSIKDYFPESFGVMDILPIYESQPELFNYAKALDRYIDDIENPTPPTLLNELRENADKQAIEFAEWVDFNATQKSEGLWYSSVLSIKIADAISTTELFELFKKSKI